MSPTSPPAAQPTRMLRRIWCGLALAIGAATLAAGWSGFGPGGLLVAFAVVPLGLVAPALRGRFPGWAAVLLPVLAGGGSALVAACVAAGAAPLTVLGSSVRDLLAAPAPAPGTAELLLPGLLLAVVTGTAVALRLDLAGRGSVAGIAGGLTLYVGGELLTAGTADPDGLLGAALAAVALLGWLTPDDLPSSASRTRRAGAPRLRLPGTPQLAATLGLVAVVPAVLAATGTTGGLEPRTYVQPPHSVIAATDPLADLALWTGHPDLQLLRAAVTGTDRLHVATLAGYTGETWQQAGVFQPFGSYAAPDLPPAPRAQRVTATVQVVRLGGPLLPAPATSTGLSVRDGVVDPASGDVAIAAGIPPGLTYSVDGAAPAPTEAALAAGQLPTGTTPSVYLAVPTPPQALVDYARTITRAATTPLQQAVAIEQAVGVGRTLATTNAPGGSSYARILTFLFRSTAEGGERGTTEQFATSFALLARLVGLPTRLVVGFHVTPAPVSAPTLVLGGDAMAWPEVYLQGAGWIAFDPTPGARTSADAAVRKQVLTDVGNKARQQPVPTPVPAPPPAVAPTVSRPKVPGPALVPRVLAGVGVLVLALLALVVVRRLLRRARRRQAGPVGAWSEVLRVADRLGDQLGRSRSAGTSAAAVAASFGAVSGPARVHADRIAAAAEEQAFGPAAGPAGEAGEAGEAGKAGTAGEAVWVELRALRREVRRGVPLRRRRAMLRRGSAASTRPARSRSARARRSTAAPPASAPR